MIYWIVVIGGGAVAASGYLLMFPFYATDIVGMQIAQIVHGTVAALFIAAMLGHIYIGTIGMEGAFEGMGTGTVDANWAKQHHSLWFAEEQAKAEQDAARVHPSATPGRIVHQTVKTQHPANLPDVSYSPERVDRKADSSGAQPDGVRRICFCHRFLNVVKQQAGRGRDDDRDGACRAGKTSLSSSPW